LFSGRKRAFEQMGDAYYFSVHSIRKKKALNEVSVSFEVFIGLNLRAFIMLFIIITSMLVVSFSF
jgi:hypothetical protein